MSDKIEVQNVNQPGHIGRVVAMTSAAMKTAMLTPMLTTMKGAAPITAAAIKAGAIPHLPDNLFPRGATAGWRLKSVQRDLVVKGVITRHATKPLTFSLA